jgi:DNA-binding CsgD family transcriptional regulator
MWNLAPAIDALGDTTFPIVMLDALNDLVEVNHLVILTLGADLVPSLFAAESFGLSPVAREAGDRYTRLQLYHSDPNLEEILTPVDRADGPLITHLLTKNIADARYREEVFEKSNIVERVSFINQREGHMFMANLYRDKDVGPFTAAQLDRVSQHAGLISSLVAKHISLVSAVPWSTATRPPVAFLEDTLLKLDFGLSQREVEVCARALLGMTSEAIGLDLGVKLTTIATHRKRAYAKMEISTTNELFALCLGYAVGRRQG